MTHVYVLEDIASSRSTGPELVGVYRTIVKAINVALGHTVERTYKWIEPNKLLVGGTFIITETEVQ